MALLITGQVEKFATIMPKIVKLVGPAGQKIETMVEIVPGAKHPFDILGISAKKGEHIRFKIKKNSSGKNPSFLLIVENQKTDKGRYVDKLYLKTDHPTRPMIEIGVFGIIS